jgi:hypothetical protein
LELGLLGGSGLLGRHLFNGNKKLGWITCWSELMLY